MSKKKPPHPRIRINYLAKALSNATMSSDFIRYMFKEFGVPWRKRKLIRMQTCSHKEHIAQSWPMQSGHQVIEIHHRIAVGDFFHVIVHEMVHVLHCFNKTTFQDKYFWDYSHDPEEHEALIWEIRYLKELGYSKKRGVEQLRIGTWEIPKDYIELLWDIGEA